MILKFNTHGNDKQKQVARLWCDHSTTEILYGGSKGCFAAGTLVQAETGLKPIEFIKPGERVWSYNVGTKQAELKTVLKHYTYGDGSQSNMITFVLRDGARIKSTDNHEYYFEGHWQSAAGLAGRMLGIHPKHTQSLFDFELWANDNNGLQRLKHSFIYEASTRQVRVFTDNDNQGRQTTSCKTAQVSGESIFTGAGKRQTFSSQPHRFQQGEQLCKQFGMGYAQTERTTQPESKQAQRVSERVQATERVQRFEGLECKANRRSGARNSGEIQTSKIHAGNACERIRRITNNNQRRNTSALAARCINLSEITEIIFEVSTETVYDLCVQDNHNYLLHDGIIVHNSGKSYLGVSLIFGDALIYPGTHYFIARSQLNDLRKYTIPSIHEVFRHWELSDKYYSYNGQDNYFNLYNKSRVYLLDAKPLPSDPLFERFGSIQMTRGWIEEAGEFDPNAKANLSATIGRWENGKYNLHRKLLMTCNPSKNFLYPDFYLKKKRGTLEPFREYIQAFPQDNKKLPDGYLEHLEQTLSPNQKQRLLYGNWEFDDDPRVLCDYQAIVDIFTNSFVEPGDLYITCDVARFGKDCTRIFVWDGWRMIDHVEMKQSKTTETATAVKQLQAKYAIPARRVCIDEDGIGGGVVDLIPGAVGFIANHSPIYTPDDTESYGTLKDQCGFWLADRINKSETYIHHLDGEHKQMCIEELEQLKARDIDSDMKNRLVPKDEIKKALAGGRSPDYLDNMIMRSYFDIIKRTQRSRLVMSH